MYIYVALVWKQFRPDASASLTIADQRKAQQVSDEQFELCFACGTSFLRKELSTPSPFKRQERSASHVSSVLRPCGLNVELFLPDPRSPACVTQRHLCGRGLYSFHAFNLPTTTPPNWITAMLGPEGARLAKNIHERVYIDVPHPGGNMLAMRGGYARMARADKATEMSPMSHKWLKPHLLQQRAANILARRN